MTTTITKVTVVKGLLVATALLSVTACGAVSTPLPYDSMRENVFDNLSDRLFANGRSNPKVRWRLKRDRVEWQYRF
jgi:hypothetical protein